jgi:hypothetical protein
MSARGGDRRNGAAKQGPTGDYEVGYRRPPKHSRWRPGQSGNLKGRPTGVRNLKTDVTATLKAPVKVTRDGRGRTVSTQEALLLRVREMALKGDPRALNLLFALAQRYNDEAPLEPTEDLSAGDEEILDRFERQLLEDAEPPAKPCRKRSQERTRTRAGKARQASQPRKSP